MKSSTDKLDRKGWREYIEGIIISFIKWIFRYSGLEFIYRKFNPSKDPQPLPTGVIWIVGIYVAFFGVASQRYENRIDIIENRANSIFAQLAVPSVQKKALSRIARVQNMPCPYKPKILNPFSVFISLFRDSKYGEMIEQLKETVEDWKGSLESVNLLRANLLRANLDGANLGGANLNGADLRAIDLRGANLRGANLQVADLRGADLRGANLQAANFRAANLWGAYLRGAEGLSAQQLCKASNLYGAKLDQELEAQIKIECPDLLKNPDQKK